MTFSQRIEHGKPYLMGLILGLIAAPIIAFSAGWVSTTGARTAAVETARVETLAGICSSAAQVSWAAQNMGMAALKGWDNRAKRGELVTATMEGMQVPEPLSKKVSAGCDKTLASS